MEVIITNDEGTTTSILGVSVGGGNVKLKQINGADISVSGNLTTLFVQQYDRPGVVAHISKCLTDYNVNIAFMKLYRDKKGETPTPSSRPTRPFRISWFRRSTTIPTLRALSSSICRRLRPMDFTKAAELLAICEAGGIPISQPCSTGRSSS